MPRFALPEIRSAIVADAASLKLPKHPVPYSNGNVVTGRWQDSGSGAMGFDNQSTSQMIYSQKRGAG